MKVKTIAQTANAAALTHRVAGLFTRLKSSTVLNIVFVPFGYTPLGYRGGCSLKMGMVREGRSDAGHNGSKNTSNGPNRSFS